MKTNVMVSNDKTFHSTEICFQSRKCSTSFITMIQINENTMARALHTSKCAILEKIQNILTGNAL